MTLDTDKTGNRPLTFERYSADCRKLIQDGKVVGYLIRDRDGLWAIKDADDRQICHIRFGTPRRAFSHARGMAEFAP